MYPCSWACFQVTQSPPGKREILCHPFWSTWRLSSPYLSGVTAPWSSSAGAAWCLLLKEVSLLVYLTLHCPLSLMKNTCFLLGERAVFFLQRAAWPHPSLSEEQDLLHTEVQTKKKQTTKKLSNLISNIIYTKEKFI